MKVDSPGESIVKAYTLVTVMFSISLLDLTRRCLSACEFLSVQSLVSE